MKRIVSEALSKNKLELFADKRIKEAIDIFINNKFQTHMEVIGENHLTIFYPLPFFRINCINQLFATSFEGTKYQDVSFHWIPIKTVVRNEFYNHYLSGFNV